jgi:tetratricopeptide (TPR) repeat protein
MQLVKSLRRSVFLALCLLSACAASTPSGGDGASAPRSHAGADTAAGAFLVGLVAGAQSDLDHAADSFNRALQLDPGKRDLEQQAFVANLLAGRPEAVRLAQRQGDNPAALLLLGDAAAASGAWGEAEARFEALPRQGVTRLLQPLLVAWAEQGSGRPDEALATLRPFVDGDRFRAVYALHAGLIADLAGEDAQAAQFYRVAQSAFGGTNLQLARILASWQARQGHVAEARETLQAVGEPSDALALAVPALTAQMATRPVRRATDGMAEAYLAVAAALRAEDATDFAGIMLRLALDLRPDLTPARLLEAELLETARHPEAALAALAPVAESDPLAAVVVLRRAGLQDRLGNTDVALRLLADLARAHPDRPEPWAAQGDVLRGAHRYVEAVAAYDRASAALGQPRREDWPLFYERGIALERSHQWPRAEADFRKALELSPDQPLVLNYLAYSWTEQGRNLAEARRMLDRAVAQRPNDGALVDSLGWVQLAQDQVAASVRTLEKAVELVPEDPTVNGHLGDAYWRAGRRLEALYQWRRALTLNPEPEDVPKLQATVREAARVEGAPETTVPEQASTVPTPGAKSEP